MKCIKPLLLPNGDVRCGQCMACRITRQAAWTGRLLLETKSHTHSAMMTLTYKKWDQSTSVNVKHIQDYLKRLRKAGFKIRYFCSSEYNDKGMPHYHLAIFGADPISLLGTTRYLPNKRGYATHHDKYWKLGRIQVDEITNKSASYICGYTLKKLTTDHKKIIKDRTPEFTLQSRKPPLGTAYLREICRNVLRTAQYHDDPAKAAVQLFEGGQIRINSKKWPLDRRAVLTIQDELESSGTSTYIKEHRNALAWKMDIWTGTDHDKKIAAFKAVEKAERRMAHKEKTATGPI